MAAVQSLSTAVQAEALLREQRGTCQLPAALQAVVASGAVSACAGGPECSLAWLRLSHPAAGQVEALLREQRSIVKLALQAVGGRWLLACLGVEEDWRQPARLDYVYDDDCANMAVHYIAAGAPVSLCGPNPQRRPRPSAARSETSYGRCLFAAAASAASLFWPLTRPCSQASHRVTTLLAPVPFELRLTGFSFRALTLNPVRQDVAHPGVAGRGGHVRCGGHAARPRPRGPAAPAAGRRRSRGAERDQRAPGDACALRAALLLAGAAGGAGVSQRRTSHC